MEQTPCAATAKTEPLHPQRARSAGTTCRSCAPARQGHEPRPHTKPHHSTGAAMWPSAGARVGTLHDNGAATTGGRTRDARGGRPPSSCGLAVIASRSALRAGRQDAALMGGYRGCVAAADGYAACVTAHHDYARGFRVCSAAPSSCTVTGGRIMRTAPRSRISCCVVSVLRQHRRHLP